MVSRKDSMKTGKQSPSKDQLIRPELRIVNLPKRKRLKDHEFYSTKKLSYIILIMNIFNRSFISFNAKL